MRFEKTGRAKEQFLEVMLNGARVFRAQGSRLKGASDWVIKDSDERRYGFTGDVAKAKAFFEATCAKALEDGFTLLGETSPRIEAMIAKERAEAALGEAELSATQLARATGAEAAELKARARAAVEQWDAAIALLADQGVGMRSVYGPRMDRVRASLL